MSNEIFIMLSCVQRKLLQYFKYYKKAEGLKHHTSLIIPDMTNMKKKSCAVDINTIVELLSRMWFQHIIHIIKLMN